MTPAVLVCLLVSAQEPAAPQPSEPMTPPVVTEPAVPAGPSVPAATSAPDPGPAPAPAVVTEAPKPPPARQCSLAVLDLDAGEGTPKARAVALSDVVTGEVGALSGCSVLSRSDIRGMLSFEAEKQLLGCSAESSSCLAELSGALGVDFLITGSVSKINDAMLLSLRMSDMKTLKVTRRATDTFAGADDEAIPFVGWLARKLITDDPAKVGEKPKAQPRRASGNTLVERRNTIWRTLAWTGVVGAGVTGAITLGLGVTTLGLSEYTRSLKETQPVADKTGIDNVTRLGPTIADGANLGLYITGGLALIGGGLFFLPGEEIAEVNIQPAAPAPSGGTQ